MSAAISQAAQWLATTPRTEIIGSVVPALRGRFGLTVMQAVQAINEANLIRARAL
jgi:hypothetical protein